MGLLGGISGVIGSVIGGKTSKKQNIAAQEAYADATNLQNKGYTDAQNYLNTNQQYGQNAISGGLNAGTGALNANLAAGTGAITDYTNRGANSINSNVTNAENAQNPYLNLGSAATAAYQNALGIGTPTGEGGYGSLNPNFTTEALNMYLSPAYEFQKSQGQQALQRQLASQNKLYSGQDLQQAVNYNQNAASTAYKNALDTYMQNINTRTNQFQNAIGTGQNSANTLSNVYSNAGANSASLYGNAGANTANLYNNTGTNLANLNLGSAQLSNNNAGTFGEMFSKNSLANAGTLENLRLGSAGAAINNIKNQGNAKSGIYGGALGTISNGIEGISSLPNYSFSSIASLF